MAENDTEKTAANVREPADDRPAPDFKRWRKDKGSDGLKRRSLRAMKAAELMLYESETREEAAESIKLLTQAANSHRRVLRDEHRREIELENVLTRAQVANLTGGIITAARDVFEAHDVPREAQEALANRVLEAATEAQRPELLEE